MHALCRTVLARESYLATVCYGLPGMVVHRCADQLKHMLSNFATTQDDFLNTYQTSCKTVMDGVLESWMSEFSST